MDSPDGIGSLALARKRLFEEEEDDINIDSIDPYKESDSENEYEEEDLNG